MPEGITVCLLVEGSYPFITGGVSAWVQELIAALPHVLFKLFTISPSPKQVLRYELPRNVVMHSDIVLNEKVRSRGRPAGGRRHL
jgi:polysaccharide biosynthesis protein PelF